MAVEFPPADVIVRVRPQLLEFIFALLRLRVPPSISVSSWWRSPQVNRAVGGLQDSQHLLGLALDLVVADRDVDELVNALADVGLVAVVEPTHVHTQLLRAGEARSLGLFTTTA